MKMPLWKLFHKNQGGFTLIELLAAVAITGVIALGVSMSTAQLLNQNSRNSNYTEATHHATNALFWISHDTLMAQRIEGSEGFPGSENLSLSWTGWDNTVHSVNYSLENGSLKRIYTDGVNTVSTLVAEHINADADMTFCSSDNGVLTFTITATTGGGARTINVTKTKEITSRPKL